MKPIYTLEYIKKEAEKIVGSWNGKDETFFCEGEIMHEDQAAIADELLNHIAEVEGCVRHLNI